MDITISLNKMEDTKVPSDNTADKKSTYSEIISLMMKTKSLLKKKLEEDPESEECKMAYDHMDQAVKALESKDSADNEDVKGMESAKQEDDYMSKLME